MRRCPVKRKDDTKIFAKFTGKHFFWSLFFNKIADWKPETPIRSHYRCSEKQSTLKSFANFTGKNVCWNILLIKLQFWGPATLLKKTLTEVFSCEIRKIFKNNYFEEHLWVSTSKRYWKRDSNIGFFLSILWIIQEHLFSFLQISEVFSLKSVYLVEQW